MAASADAEFPCSLSIHTPFPSPRLATIALRALAVDAELSPLVRRSFSLSSSAPEKPLHVSPRTGGALRLGPSHAAAPAYGDACLVTAYRATTNRMLRVAVNGFFESLGVVIACMRELDGEDAVAGEWLGDGLDGEDEDAVDGLVKVQGLQEVGLLNRG